MSQQNLNQWLSLNIQDDFFEIWQEAFLIDRKAQNVAAGTLYFYQKKLKLFTTFCETQAITKISQITPETIRRYLLWLEETGHNSGGVNGCYRVLKTFLLWWENENEPAEWKNPIRKVKAPKVGIEPLEPVELEDIAKMIDTCHKGEFYGDRDKAILLALLDTGARASEFCNINLDDINQITGEILIRQGKGHKPRFVYLGQKARKAVRIYLRHRQDNNPALWTTHEGERLTYWGLNEVISRRANMANIKKPELHAFRRAFALNCLRNGVDIYSLQALMGHADLQVLRRYLKQTNDDLQLAHRKGSPVDNAGW